MADLKKKFFWISGFFTPKMGKNLVLGALLPGAKRGCAPTAPAKIFWSVMQNIPRNNISKIWEVFFPQFSVKPFSLFSSFYTCVYRPLVAIFVALKNKFWKNVIDHNPSFHLIPQRLISDDYYIIKKLPETLSSSCST